MYNTTVSEMWNTLMGVTGTLESMTGNTAFINTSSKGEAEGNVNERHSQSIISIFSQTCSANTLRYLPS